MTEARPSRYSTAAIALHWLIAALLVFQLALGWRLDHLAEGTEQFAGYQLHKSVGIAILLFSLARLGIRWVFPRPAPVEGGKAATWLAKAVHALLYVVMIGGPITGWIAVSTSKIKLQTMLFGLVPWPSLPLGEGWHEPAEGLHELIATLFVLLVFLHIAGALMHHFRKQDTIGRMLPARFGSHRSIGMAAVVALLGLVAAFAAARAWPFGSHSTTASAQVAASGEPQSPTPASSAAPTVAASTEAAPSEAASLEASPTPDIAEAALPWQVEPGGRLGFSTSYSGSAVSGSFARWSADIRFSPQDLAGSRIRVTIDLASVDTAEAERDDMLRSSSFFNIGAHPRATFVSNAIRERGPGRYVANGTLTLHGRSRPVAVSFDLDIAGNRASTTGSASLSRAAYGVGSGEWSATDTVPDGVSVNFRFSARRQ